MPAISPDTVIFVALFAVLAAAILGRPASRRQFRRFVARRHWPPTAPRIVAREWAPPTLRAVPRDSADPAEQLRAVMAGSFTRKRVLSRTEAKVLAATEAAISEAGLNWRVMAQVSLGEVLSSPDEAAFRAVNAKRVDLLVVSAAHLPIAAIEYQGDGHWQGAAPARDAVKKEALRRAGVGYVEISPAHGPDDVRREIARLAAATRRHGGQTAPRPTPGITGSAA